MCPNHAFSPRLTLTLLRTSKDDAQVSPTSTTATRGAPSSNSISNATAADRRLSDLANYRRDLSVLEPSRSHPPASSSASSLQQPQHLPQHSYSVGSLAASSQVAPWISSSVPPGPSPKGLTTSFYNDSSDNVSMASQFSPGLPSASNRPGTGSGSISQEYADTLYYNLDGRRPSAASVVTTASSQGSKTSVNRGGFRKLQGFFGEEFPGRDSSESSLPISVPGKDQRSRSYSHGRPTQRDRNFSNATDREPSPASSRPRTPVPNPEVVPFLYQDNTVRPSFPFLVSRPHHFAPCCFWGVLAHLHLPCA
jgi:adenylate cyclase